MKHIVGIIVVRYDSRTQEKPFSSQYKKSNTRRSPKFSLFCKSVEMHFKFNEAEK